MSSLRKLASQTVIYGMSSIIGRVVVWAFTPILTRFMHTGEYGIFSDLYAFITYFLVILTFGMETAFFRFAKSEKGDHRAYDFSFNFVALLGIAFLLLFSGGNPFISKFLGYEDRPLLIWLLTFITFLDVVTAIPMAKLRYDERPMVFAAVSLAGILVNVVFNVWFFIIQEKKTAEYVFLANLYASLFKLILMAWLALPAGRFRPWPRIPQLKILPASFTLERGMLGPVAGFGAFIMLAGLLGMITQNSDVNFIKRIWGEMPHAFRGISMTGAEMAGIFSANKKLAVLILLVTQAFRYAAEPFFFRHSKESKDREVYAKVFHYFMIASLITGMLIASFSMELVSFRIGKFQLIDQKYWSGLDAVPLMLASFILFGAYTNFSIWYKLSRQVRFGLFFSIAGSVVIIALNLALIGRWGYSGANLATFIGYIVMTLLTFFAGQKYYPIPYRIPRILLLGFMLCGVYYLNTLLGQGHIGDLVFFKKLLVSICGIALVYLIEKARPVFAAKTEANPPA